MWQQRGRADVAEPCLAACREILKDVTALLTARGDYRKDILDEATSYLAVGAVAGLAPHHGVPQRPLRRVVRGLDTLNAHERPQGRLDRQDLPARARGLGAGAGGAGLQLGPDPGTQLGGVAPEGRASHRAVPD